MIAKNGFGLLLAVNYVKMTQLWCNSNSTCRATYWMYIPSFKLISQSMLKKSPETRTDGQTDGRTDGRTFPRHNTSRFSNGRIKIKKNMVISCYYSLAWILGCPQAISCCHWLLIKWSKVELLISGHARWFTISISEWHVASDQINSSSYTWDIIVMFKIHWNVKKYISPEDEYS